MKKLPFESYKLTALNFVERTGDIDPSLGILNIYLENTSAYGNTEKLRVEGAWRALQKAYAEKIRESFQKQSGLTGLCAQENGVQ